MIGRTEEERWGLRKTERGPVLLQQRTQEHPKKLQEHPEAIPRWAQEDQEIDSEPQDEKRTAARLTRPPTNLSKVSRAQFSTIPRGGIGRAARCKNGTENGSKMKPTRKKQKEAVKTIPKPFWIDLGSFGSAMLGEKASTTSGKRKVS